MNVYKGAALFAGGRAVWLCRVQTAVQQGCQKAYTHATAAALRMKESVMEAVTSVQENAADILASAREINEQRAQEEADAEADDAQV